MALFSKCCLTILHWKEANDFAVFTKGGLTFATVIKMHHHQNQVRSVRKDSPKIESYMENNRQSHLHLHTG